MPPKRVGDVLIHAHRGSSGVEPENTLRAFRRALADGAGGVEFDVRATSDGVPVVIHDEDLTRTTDRQGRVSELTLAQVKEADAGHAERVPTLAEALALLSGRLRLYVDLKRPGIERAVLDVLSAYPNAEWVIASSNIVVLRAVRALSPKAELWPISWVASDEAFAAAKELGATTISLFRGAVTEDVARRFEAEDLDLAVWTVNRVEDARQLRYLGASSLCTDVPAEIIQGLASRRGSQHQLVATAAR